MLDMFQAGAQIMCQCDPRPTNLGNDCVVGGRANGQSAVLCFIGSLMNVLAIVWIVHFIDVHLKRVNGVHPQMNYRMSTVFVRSFQLLIF